MCIRDSARQREHKDGHGHGEHRAALEQPVEVVQAPGQLAALRTTLSAVTVPVDKALATILSFLGVGLGEADVWMNGLRCDRAVLVH